MTALESSLPWPGRPCYLTQKTNTVSETPREGDRSNTKELSLDPTEVPAATRQTGSLNTTPRVLLTPT